MVHRSLGHLMRLALFVSLAFNVYAQFTASVVVGNTPPEILSVRTFSSYTNDAINVPCSAFSAPSNKLVYIQVKVRDPNGPQEIRDNGYVKVRITFLDATTETEFTRFGSAYLPATFESESGDEAIYTHSFQMDDYDPERLGTETPPLYYRVKAQVSDGLEEVTSNTTSSQNADYTYDALDTNPPPEPPLPPPTTTTMPSPVLFDISIEIPENKRTVDPGDSFYATVAITKMSPPGTDDTTITYKIIDPLNRTVGYLVEMVALNQSVTVYRVPVLYIPEDAVGGTYTFRATVAYNGVEAWSEATFTVRGPVVTTTSTTPPGTSTTCTEHPTSTRPYSTTVSTRPPTTTTVKKDYGGIDIGGISIPLPAEMKREITFYKYPGEISAFQGETKPLMVIVENVGDLVLEDVTVYVGGPISLLKVVPESIANVETGSRKIFMVNIRIPDKLPAGTYDMTLKAIAKYATDERHIKLVVLDTPHDAQMDLKRTLDDLENLVNAIWGEAVEIGISEKDAEVFDVFKLLKDAKESLQRARNNWMNGQYDKTMTEINEARDHIENSVITLAVLKSGGKKGGEVVSTKEVTVYTMPPFLWALALMALLAVILLAYDRRRNRIPGRQLEEKYELKRTKDLIYGRAGSLQDHAKETRISGNHKTFTEHKKKLADKDVLSMLRDKVNTGEDEKEGG